MASSTERPYIQSLVADLRALAESKNVTDKVIDDIVHELGFRTKPGATKLLEKLVAQHPRLREPAKTVKKKQAAKKAVARANAPRHTAPTSSGPIVFTYEENSVAYEFLRNTFTEEGELLAKWGMTPTLPEDVIEKTFKLWEEHLSKNQDPMFRTVAQLKIDREKLARIRARARKKNEGR